MAAHPRPAGPTLHSLAEAAPGTLVEVVHILFGSLRERYEAAGIRAGTRLRPRCRTAERVLVELADGGMVEVDAVHAPFMEVRPLSPDAAAEHRPGLAARSFAAPRAGVSAVEPMPNPNLA